MMSDDSGRYRWSLKAVSLSLLIVGLVALGACVREDTPLEATVPSDPVDERAGTTIETPVPSTTPTTTVDDLSTDDLSSETPTPTTTVVGLSTDGPDDESSLEDPAPEVELDVPPSEAFDETNIQAEEWLVGPFGRSAYGDPQAAPWLFPWGDGFLQIGFFNTSEQMPSEMNLFARTSADGLNWGESFQLDLPREHFEALETVTDSYWISSWPKITSNGKALVVLSQQPGQHIGRRGANAALFRRNAPAGAHVEQRVSVSVTDDLESWNHYEYPLLPPAGINRPLLGNHVVAEDVIVSDEGWIIQVSTLTYMDIGLLVPHGIRELSDNINWLQYDDMYLTNNDGLLVEWVIEDTNAESFEIHKKFFSWEELGVTRELFERYGFLPMKSYHFSHHFTGSLLVGRWGEGPVRVELPPVRGVCCEIIATDAGYIGLSDAVEPGYPQGKFGWGALIFSPDGLTWQRIDPPADEVFKEPENYDNYRVWVSSIHAVGDRVVMHGLESGPYYICGDGDRSRFQFEYIWVGDATGSMWESQKIYDNPCHARYRIAKSAGRGIFLYINVQFDNSEESYTWEGRYHSTIVSADGVNWFTFYEEPDPNRSSVAFNGNVAVRVDNAGNSYRYELQ